VYEAGDRLPSEAEFCEEFGVSRMTLRKALTILTDQGLISAKKGKGTFARPFDLGDSVFSLKQAVGRLFDGRVEVQLLSASTIGASRWIANKLDIDQGDKVVYIRQLVVHEDSPAIYHRDYVRYDPRRPLVELLLRSTSLYGLLQTSQGESLPHAQITLRACALGATAARILQRPSRAPALCIEHLFLDADHHPLAWGRFLLRSDMFALRTSLGPVQKDSIGDSTRLQTRTTRPLRCISEVGEMEEATATNEQPKTTHAPFEQGYVQIYTGDGKGKTTAAMGLAVRAAGAGLRVFIGQFIKMGRYSEIEALDAFGDRIVWRQFGRGRWIRGRSSDDDIALARQGLTEVRDVLSSGEFKVVILDEILMATWLRMLDVQDILDLIEARPAGVELVLTGRRADPKLIARADLVTEMCEVKHYYKKGVLARKGIES